MMHSRFGGQRHNRSGRRLSRVPLQALALLAAMCGALVQGAAAEEDLKKAGSVQIEQGQITFIVRGPLGGGKLQFGGRSYDFTIGGLGIGGFGISKINATGDVYN